MSKRLSTADIQALRDDWAAGHSAPALAGRLVELVADLGLDPRENPLEEIRARREARLAVLDESTGAPTAADEAIPHTKEETWMH